MSLPVVRSFVPSDMQALYGLYREIYTTAETMSESFDEKYPNLVTFRDAMVDLTTRSGHIALLVEVGGNLEGYLTILPKSASKLKHTGDLNMGVTERGRGKGLGKMLLSAAIDTALRDGLIEIVYLMVRSDNEPAINLYVKQGFQKLATLPRDVKIGNHYFDGIFMRLQTGQGANA